MAKHIVMALTNPVEGREADYNAWFETAHIPELLAVPGFLSAQRYEVAGDQVMPDRPPYQYVTVYEVESDDLGATLPQFGLAARNGTNTDASDTSRRAIWVYSRKGDKHLPK